MNYDNENDFDYDNPYSSYNDSSMDSYDDHSMDQFYISHAAFQEFEAEMYERLEDIRCMSYDNKDELLENLATELFNRYRLYDYDEIRRRIKEEYYS